MAVKTHRGPTPWSHEGLERRGYRKCPYCWRHLVKIEEHVDAHRAGRIGPNGKRRDRSRDEARRRTEPFDGALATVRFRGGIRRRWVPRADLERLAALPPDRDLLRDVDKAVDQRP